MLNVTKKILTKQGYQVIGIASPTEALATLELYHGKFDLILTDIMMPEMNGKELTIEIHKKYPTLKILWMSGYTADILDEKAGVDGQIDMLKKPFTPAELIEKIQHLLK